MFDASDIEGEMAEVCGVLNATTGRLVELIGRAVETRAWEGAGIRSAEHWVAWQCGVSPRRARTLVAMAGRLPELPVTRAAFEAGALTEDQTAVVCRHAPTVNDAEMADFARAATVSQLDRTLRTYQFSPDPPPAPEAPVEEIRRVSFGTDDTCWSMTVRAPLDEGAIIEQALTAARQDLFAGRDGDSDRDVDWMDALLAVAERSLEHPTVTRPRRDRYVTMLHLHTDPTPVGHLHGGPALPDALRRLLTCDGLVRPVHHTDGVPVSVGRRQRIVPDRTRLLIEERDRGCRVPGCDRRRWLHVHHVSHWEDGGCTDTDNLVALCGYHHRLHHRDRLGISGNPDQPDGLTFTDAGGRAIRSANRPVPPGDPPDQAAIGLGIDHHPYVHPIGERLDQRNVWFSEGAPVLPG